MCKPLSLKRRTAQTEALTGTAMYETLESLNSANRLILASQNYIMLKFGLPPSLKHSAVFQAKPRTYLITGWITKTTTKRILHMHTFYTTQCVIVLANPGVQAKPSIVVVVVSLSWPASSCSFCSFFQLTLSDSEPQHDFPRVSEFGKVPGNGRQTGSHPTETMETRGRIEVLILLSKLLDSGHPALS